MHFTREAGIAKELASRGNDRPIRRGLSSKGLWKSPLEAELQYTGTTLRVGLELGRNI